MKLSVKALKELIGGWADKAIKHIKGLVEEAKVSIRNIRKQFRKELAGSKDEIKTLEVESQKIIEASIHTVGELANKVLGRL